MWAEEPGLSGGGEETDSGYESAEGGDGAGGPAVGVGDAGVVEVGLGCVC